MTTSSPSDPTTLNIPSLLAFAVISILAIRYLFFTPSSPTTSSTHSTSSPGSRRVPADRIEQIMVMFPQLQRRDVEWDLSRNGANVASTTERVLREGRLPGAPPSFQPQPIPSSTRPSTATTSSSVSQRTAPAYSDLITRYNLSARVSATNPVAPDTEIQETMAAPSAVEKGKGKAGESWSTNKEQRQALLKKRREDMILEARRKMEERDRVGKA